MSGGSAMIEQQGVATVGTALLVCDDPIATRQVTEALQELALSVEVSLTASLASRRINETKIEVAVVEFSLGGPLFLEHLRASPSNRNVVTIAITKGSDETSRALKAGSGFAMQRPLTKESISHTLRAAYGMIVRERRRYYRHPVVVAAALSMKDGSVLFGKTHNVSESGMAFHSDKARVTPGVNATAQFKLENPAVQVTAECKVCWANDKGQAGLSFVFVPSTTSAQLQSWLAQRLEEQLPSSVSQRFQ
jgi:CheY-like chemotaxis protein